MQNLTEMFFGTDVTNDTGRKNIRGDELATLITGGASPLAGAGALVTLTPGTTIPDASPPLPLDWTGATVVYDDLGFFVGAGGFIIPVTDPPITRVRFWGNVIWAPAVGQRSLFQTVTFALPPGSGTVVLPETGSAIVGATMEVQSAAMVVVIGDGLNLLASQVSGAPNTIAEQEMAIEVVR